MDNIVHVQYQTDMTICSYSRTYFDRGSFMQSCTVHGVPVIERSVVRESDPRIVQAFSHVKYVSFDFNCTDSF